MRCPTEFLHPTRRRYRRPIDLRASPDRVSAPHALDWLSETTLGRMLGDYISVSWVGGRVIPVLSLAGEPGFTMAQAIFATRATS